MARPTHFKIALAQINPVVGDFEGNLQKHLDCIEKAKKEGVRLLIFSELSFVGYMPRDIILEPHFLNRQNLYLHKLQEAVDDIYVIVGCVTKNQSGVEKAFFNSAVCFHNKSLVFTYDKRLLPTYNVFDERRYFEPGKSRNIFEIQGVKIGMTICEDMWQHTHATSSTCYKANPIGDFIDRDLDLIINMSGSPYFPSKVEIRQKILQAITKDCKCPMVYVNQVGANDAIIFDGYSMFVHPSGDTIFASGFSEDLKILNIFQKPHSHASLDNSFDLERALSLGIRDYVHKNGFHNVVVGLSGGIDSALVLALCVEALGAERVKAIYMPSIHSREISFKIASQIAMNFNVSIDVVPINRLVESYIQSLEEQLNLSSGGIALENIQSRIRGNIIMAYANKYSALMMGCSNKTELAIGYGTLYGDIAGALLPIGDLFKFEVYKLAHSISRGRFPEEVFTRAPSAELYMNQQDIDTLPPYEIVDPILKYFIEKGQSRDVILQAHPEFEGHIDHILHLLKISEFKRYQAPMILKVSKRNFGTGWDFPITRK